jgi:hypothetical protein
MLRFRHAMSEGKFGAARGGIGSPEGAKRIPGKKINVVNNRRRGAAIRTNKLGFP